MARPLRGIRAIFVLGLGLAVATLAQAQDAATFPRFRHAEQEAMQGSAPPASTIRLLAEGDYAPWSFTLDDGTMAGIAVEMALVACEDAGLSCEVLPTPFTGLAPALAANEGDVIISGMRVTTEIEAQFAMTRPYFKSVGQFVIRSGTPIPGADPRSLQDRRIGYIKDTLHGVFLQKYYGRSTLVPENSEAELFEALRTGALDAVFADGVRAMFWMNGDQSRDCCERLGGAMVDPETVTRPLVFVLRQDSLALRDRLDAALDQMEETGRTATIFQRYLPGKVW